MGNARVLRFLLALTLVAVGAIALNPGGRSVVAPEVALAREARATARPAVSLPRFFVEEPAGADGPRRFVAAGREASIVLARGGPSWIVHSPAGADRPARVRVDFVPVNGADVEPVGREATIGRVSRFRGARDDWRVGMPTFRSVAYPSLWPGVDLTVEAKRHELKSTFVVAPGVDASVVRFRIRGASSVRIDDAGRLVVTTAAGEVVDEAPVAWLDDGTAVGAAFRLEGTDGAFELSFDVDEYDGSRTLWLDPAVVAQSGFLGGAGSDSVGGVRLDGDGNIYVAGGTVSSEATFPVIVGPDLTIRGTTGDAFVAKLDPTGTTLLYLGYVGGDLLDYATDVAVDSQGRAYLSGITEDDRDTANFPVVVGPDLIYGGGSFDG